jgi:hypothetical protein
LIALDNLAVRGISDADGRPLGALNFGSTGAPAGSVERKATEPGALCARLCSAKNAKLAITTPSKRMNEIFM